METITKASEGVKDANREQIQEWLINDLKRIQSLAGMLQDPLVLPRLVDHIEGLMINEKNRKAAAKNAREMEVNHG